MIDFNMMLPDPVLFALTSLESKGFMAHCVGGCVRDSIMGIKPKDYDITTSASPSDVLSVFAEHRTVETGLKHGTVTLVYGGMNIEITTYRIDGNYSDGRHPDSVSFTKDLSEDLKRRDFTMNAMAYSPDGGLVDLFGGVRDIEEKTVRCVGPARDRFSEDGLRILRALRFSSVLGFRPDRECSDAVRGMRGLLDGISRERIYSEMSKLVTGAGASDIISSFPEVVAFALSCQEEDIANGASNIARDEKIYGKGSEDHVLRYAELLDRLDDEKAISVFSSLKPSKHESSRLKRFIGYRDLVCKDIYSVLKLISETDDSFPALLSRFQTSCLRADPCAAEGMSHIASDIIESNRCRSIKMLAVGGNDLVSAGIPPAYIGNILSSLLDRVMREEIGNDKEVLLERATSLAWQL